ncbi:MAG: alpha/beta fold hydrolase [Oculatellaceae cyanobacterium Prado106]|nr:alpha/beta fold hydrolase [Oculatellaceae cyanobacterium Prado106]
MDRAYTVAWALRGSPSQRRTLRPSLGWIAVSSEDDSPHAPTNVSATEDHMGELSLRVGRSGQQVILRGTLTLPITPGTDPLPNIASRPIPAPTAFTSTLHNRSAAGYDELFLFVHGLGSRAEESSSFKRRLIEIGAAAGRRYAILSVDMPGMGYSSRLDLDGLISRRARGGHHGFKLPNGVDSNFPILGLYRDTLVEICNSVAGGVQYVMGGSLGGNMTLWLAAEPMFTDLDPARSVPSSVVSFLSWSPASIWESYERSRDTPFEGNGTHMDIGKNGVKKQAQGRMRESENDRRRWEFFEKMQRGEEIFGLHIVGAWGYPPNPTGLLLQSELYSEQYRRTFWAAAYEQVTFSHQEPLTPSRRWPFQTIQNPLFLAAGAFDTGDHGSHILPGIPFDHDVMDIYNPVIAVTDRSPDVPGRRHLMLETEHSISDKRPHHLARQIVDFLLVTVRNPRIRDQLVVVPDTTGTAGNDLWAMKFDPTARRWVHMSQIAGHPFAADINCDDVPGILPTTFGVKLVVAGDFDRDGRQELVVVPDTTGTAGNDLWAMKFDPTARRWVHMSLIAGLTADINCDDVPGVVPTRFGVKFAVAGDFDGDGQQELVVVPDTTGTASNDLWAMKFNPTARHWFHMSQIAGHPFAADINCDDVPGVSPTTFGVKFVVAGDFDGDGQQELVVVPDTTGTASNDLWAMKFDPTARRWVHMSQIAGHPFAADINCDDVPGVVPTRFGVKFLVAGDFDGDGRQELVVVPDTTGTAGNDLWAMKFDPTARRWVHMSQIAGHPFAADINCDDVPGVVPTRFGVKFSVKGSFEPRF